MTILPFMVRLFFGKDRIVTMGPIGGKCNHFRFSIVGSLSVKKTRDPYSITIHFWIGDPDGRLPTQEGN